MTESSATPAETTSPEPALPHTTDPVPPAEPKKKTSAGPLVAALAVGALLGGASGAGVATIALTANQNAVQDETGNPQTITVNDADDVNAVTAVAAKASPSVVTISVTSSASGGTGSGVVLSSDGDRIRLRQDRDGRVREVSLTMLKIEDPTIHPESGKRHFRLARKH